MATSHILQLKTRIFAENLKRNRVDPAAVVVAEFSYYKKVDKSGPISCVDLVKTLREKLLKVGPLYSKINGNTLGCCAEINASNQVLYYRPNLCPGKIVFSKAIRPRTMQEVPQCKNCKLIFS